MDGMTAPALFWAWVNSGRRWHLITGDADLALCGVGTRGWELVADDDPFDPADIDVAACLPCLRAEKQTATTGSTAAGEGAG